MSGGKLSGKDLGLFILRVALGVIFIWHGVQLLWGPNAPGISGLEDRLGKMGIPAPLPMAYALLASEIGGGLLLILGGFLAQVGAFAIAVVMAVAIAKVHLHDRFLFQEVTQPDGSNLWRYGLELNIAYLAMALCILFAGPGYIGVIPRRKSDAHLGGP